MKDLRFGQSPDRLVYPSLLLFALRMAEGFIRFSSGVRSKLAVGWNFGLSTHWSQTGKAASLCRTILCCRSILLLFFSIGIASSFLLWVVLHGSLPLAFSTSSVEDISSF
ncbi:unnamed protein product [Brassica oleracea var. botrytis]